MTTAPTTYDAWLTDDGPAALVLREHLMPADGVGGVLFPPTYAPSEDKVTFKGGYNIDSVGSNRNVCQVDSIGAQANRLEPLFESGDYAKLVPQVVIQAGDRRVNLLRAGHRAADALVRYSSLRDDLEKAFLASRDGNAEPLAKIAPTSLVFGAWDSRRTQVKLARLLTSVIRAYNVHSLRRSALYKPELEKHEVRQLIGLEPESEDKKDELSELGLLNSLASGSHGGVIARGGVRRDAMLSLVGLRALGVQQGTPPTRSPEATQVLQRYILGLALVALTAPMVGERSQLRQGCLLVANPDKGRDFHSIYPDGRNEPLGVTHVDAKAFAAAAATAFGVGPDRNATFDPKTVSADLGLSSTERKQQRKGRKAAEDKS